MDQIGPMEALAIVVLAGYAVWVVVFFGTVRPRLMSAIGRRLGVAVAESHGALDAGTYTTVGQRVPIVKTGLVSLADLIVLLLGTVGMAALIFVPMFVLTEAGAFDPLQSLLTGRRVALVLPATVPTVQKRAAQSTVTLTVMVRNEGRDPERACQVRVADYEARNGYLTGNSAFFDLPPGAERAVPLELWAPRAPVGLHSFRLKVECANRRLVVHGATFQALP